MITLLKSKLHRASISEVNIDYEGSCAIDEELMYAACIQEYEQLHIFNVNTGDRFVTYAIKSDVGGMISLNGSAARCGVVGDKIIICTYQQLPIIHDPVHPKLVMLTENNEIVQNPKNSK